MISHLAARLAGAGAELGIRDDCAVLPMASSGFLLVTTDAQVEGRHFQLVSVEPRRLGRKLVAVTLSDIAAMGGIPWAMVVNIQLSANLELSWIEAFYDGVADAADEYAVQVVGGNTTSANESSFCATALGTTPDEPLRRSTARVGDELWVSGSVGGAEWGRALEEGRLDQSSFADQGASALRRFREPTPRLLLGQKLREQRLATAAIDISDGLIQDTRHIAETSGVDIEIDLERVPLEATFADAGALRLEALGGGEDYEVLFTAHPAQAAGIEALAHSDRVPALTRIGAVKARAEQSPRILLRSRGTTCAAEVLFGRGGFDHFRVK